MILPKILITIDTEVGEKAKFVEGGYQKFVLGRIEKENYGVPKIVEMLNDYNFKFFWRTKFCRSLHKP
jgi:hypothetical protein